MQACVRFHERLSLGGTEQDVHIDSQIRFRRFVNPVQITVASFFSPRRALLFETRLPRQSLPDGEY